MLKPGALCRPPGIWSDEDLSRSYFFELVNKYCLILLTDWPTDRPFSPPQPFPLFPHTSILSSFCQSSLHTFRSRPISGGRRTADEEEQHDVISALLGWHEERGGVERPHGGSHRALLHSGRHRGQVGLVDGSAVWPAAACFDGDEKQTRDLGFWIRNAISAGWGGDTSFDSVSFM